MNRREMLKTSGAAILPVSATAAERPLSRYERLLFENRRMCLYLGHDVLETILGGWAKGWECISLPVLSGLPSDVIVEAVHYDFSRRSFAVHLMHESFDWALPGTLIKAFDSGFQCITFEKLSARYRVPSE